LLGEHTALGDTLPPWVGGLFLLTVTVVLGDRLAARRRLRVDIR
jgi:hypothetical protein